MAPSDWSTVTIRGKKPANFGNMLGTNRAVIDKVVSTIAGDSGVVPAAIGEVSEETADRKRETRADAAKSNAVEGKLGEGKRKYGLGLNRAKLANTSESGIALQVQMMT